MVLLDWRRGQKYLETKSELDRERGIPFLFLKHLIYQMVFLLFFPQAYPLKMTHSSDSSPTSGNKEKGADSAKFSRLGLLKYSTLRQIHPSFDFLCPFFLGPNTQWNIVSGDRGGETSFFLLRISLQIRICSFPHFRSRLLPVSPFPNPMRKILLATNAAWRVRTEPRIDLDLCIRTLSWILQHFLSLPRSSITSLLCLAVY